MPMLIQHIDAIARQKQRGVLYVEFRNPPSEDDECPDPFFGVDWENLPVRQQIIDWLNAHGISWEPCAHFATVNMMMSYIGQIYIDVPYDLALPSYQELQAFLENPDGTMRLPNTMFYFLPLEKAMENAAHDEPGFWERWAEDF